MDVQSVVQLVMKSRLSENVGEKFDFGKAGEELAAEIMSASRGKREGIRAAVVEERR